MIPEDRVVVTDTLVALADDPDANGGFLVVPSALLDRLDPTGVHVVVPTAGVQSSRTSPPWYAISFLLCVTRPNLSAY